MTRSSEETRGQVRPDHAAITGKLSETVHAAITGIVLEAVHAAITGTYTVRGCTLGWIEKHLF